MRYRILGNLGDELGLTAAVREFALQHPDDMIRLDGKSNPDVWINCPWLGMGNQQDPRNFACYSFQRQCAETWNTRTQHYMKLMGLDLSRVTDVLPEFYFTAAELAAPIKVYRTEIPTESRWSPVEEAMPQSDEKIVAIDPGAGWRSRVWAEARFHQLSRALVDKGYKIVQLGSRGRRKLDGATVDLVGRVRLRDLARLIGRFSLFIGNDSGLQHVAAAVGTPQVIVYGPTRFAAGPYPSTVAVAPASDCSRHCFMDCGRRLQKTDAQISHCMDEITVEQVLAGVDQALGLPRPPSRLVPALTRLQAWELRQAARIPATPEEKLFAAISGTGSRRGTFDMAARLAMKRGAKHLVETGSFRSWGDGGSTFIWARLAAVVGGELTSFDIDPERQRAAAQSIGEERTNFVPGDSVERLKDLAASGKTIDLLYLDSLDVGHGNAHQLHQLAEIQAAYPALSTGAVVVIDDDSNDRGKGRLSRPWLESKGWRVVDRQYQSVLVRGVPG